MSAGPPLDESADLPGRLKPRTSERTSRAGDAPDQAEYLSLEQLAKALVERAGRSDGAAVCVERQANVYESTATSEVITISVAQDVVTRMFSKSMPARGGGALRWRWGEEYESRVYRDVLSGSGTSVPEYYGTWTDHHGGRHLGISWIDAAVRVDKAWPKSSAMVPTASWLGRFHRRLAAGHLTADQRAILEIHGNAYYQEWFERARSFLEAASRSHANLAGFAGDPGPIISLLQDGPQSVVHGDFSPSNVLISREGVVVVVDWESAAIGPCVIDLASLTEGWGPRVTSDCVAIYSEEMTDVDLPSDFHRHIAAGRVYHYLRVENLSADAFATAWGQRRAELVSSALDEALV